MDGPRDTPDPANLPPAPDDVLVEIVDVPPEGAPDSEAAARQEALVAAGRGDRADLERLAGEQPWLSPGRAFACGHLLLTEGLHDLTGGPELEMVNVPAPFVPAATELLGELASYLFTNGVALAPGQLIDLGAERGGILVVAPAEGPWIADDVDRLRIVFLG